MAVIGFQGGKGRALRELLEINPWAKPYIVSVADDTGVEVPVIVQGNEMEGPFRSARSQAALERAQEGPTKWNAWANRMREIRALCEGLRTGALLWAELAALDLSGSTQSRSMNFGGFGFPGAVRLRGTSFLGEFWFNHVTVMDALDVQRAVFQRGAWFEGSQFEGNASLAMTRWHAQAEFRGCSFHSSMTASGASFSGDLWMVGSQFTGPANFSKVSFGGEAGFGRCHFVAPVEFAGCRFIGNAGFEGARFDERVSLGLSEFCRNARFAGAVFSLTPEFEGTRFAREPLFDINVASISDRRRRGAH